MERRSRWSMASSATAAVWWRNAKMPKDGSTFLRCKEPYRIEGKKTMGYELAEQLGWELPDAIFYPTGGGVEG